ncbi:MAG: hypothetical protein ACRDZO_05840 [Egibacteraceae bacterium]
MNERARERLSLRLEGGDYGDGEIPLLALAHIASETQQLVRRLARSLTQRSGPGRTPGSIENATNLLLIDLQPGSTMLTFASPPVVQPMLGFFEEVGAAAFGALMDGIEALENDAELPAAFDDVVSKSLDGWLDAVKSAAPAAEVRAELSSRPPRVLRLEPEAAQAALARRSPNEEPSEQGERTIEGRLYAVNLETGRYALRDDAGNSISLTGEGIPSDAVGRFVGQRVQAEGVAHIDTGHLQSLDVARLDLARPFEGEDRDWFYRGQTLAELLEGTEPLDSLDDLVIEDLTDEEIEAFLEAGDE